MLQGGDSPVAELRFELGSFRFQSPGPAQHSVSGWLPDAFDTHEGKILRAPRTLRFSNTIPWGHKENAGFPGWSSYWNCFIDDLSLFHIKWHRADQSQRSILYPKMNSGKAHLSCHHSLSQSVLLGGVFSQEIIFLVPSPVFPGMCTVTKRKQLLAMVRRYEAVSRARSLRVLLPHTPALGGSQCRGLPQAFHLLWQSGATSHYGMPWVCGR